MTKRLFYKCPVIALYMMREFGVKFECKNSDEEIQEYDLKDDDIFYHFGDSGLGQPDTIDDLIAEFLKFRKIYVKIDSDSFFVRNKDEIVNGKHFFMPEVEGE